MRRSLGRLAVGRFGCVPGDAETVDHQDRRVRGIPPLLVVQAEPANGDIALEISGKNHA